MQDIDPKDDLLERPGGNYSSEDRIGLVERLRPSPNSRGAADGCDECLVGYDRPGVPARGERAGQLPGVPSLSGGENDEMQATAAPR